MKRLIPFLFAILLLTGCSPAAVELPTNTPIPPTAMVAPTSTATPTSVPSLAAPEITTCAYDKGFIILPGGQEKYAEYFGWTSTGEYYVGADFPGEIVFCYLEKDFTGKITGFDYRMDYYAENVPDQVLDDIGREGLFQVFPTPDGKRYIFLKVAEPPKLQTLNRYDIWLWDTEEQETTLVSDSEEEFWRECKGFLPPEKVWWLNENLLFVNCETGDVPDYFYIDLQKKEFVSIGNSNCYWNEFFRGYTFSPDGNQHLSVGLGGDFDNYGINPLLVAQTKDTLKYIHQCSETEDRLSGLWDFMQQTKEIPYEAFSMSFLNSALPTVRWSADSKSLYLIDFDSEHTTYGDILKYNLDSGTVEPFVEFERLKSIFPDIREYGYYFDISPSEEYVFIGFPQGPLTKIKLEDLR